MLSRGRYFPEQAATGEPVILFVRRHWFSFSTWLILTVIMLATPLFLLPLIVSASPTARATVEFRTLLTLATSAYYLFILAVFLVAWIDYYLDVTIVTPKRLVDVHQNGLFNHQISEQSLLRVQDVSVRVQGPFQTFFQYGTVYVETAGEAPNFVMRNLPRPSHVASTIIELHNQLVEHGFTASEDQPKQLRQQEATE